LFGMKVWQLQERQLLVFQSFFFFLLNRNNTKEKKDMNKSKQWKLIATWTNIKHIYRAVFLAMSFKQG
jgi:hypothetical protein